MEYNKYPSKIFEETVEMFLSLEGIGRKTAHRMVLNILKKGKDFGTRFGNAILKLTNEIKYCKKCCNISDNELCEICSNPLRNQHIVCVVEEINDVMAIEETHQFDGLYHVLGGVISPINGIGPGDLTLTQLEKRIQEEPIKELILALSPTIEGDTTAFFIYKKLKNLNIKITTLAKGISIGNELEYTDIITLGNSIKNRVNFNPEN